VIRYAIKGRFVAWSAIERYQWFILMLVFSIIPFADSWKPIKIDNHANLRRLTQSETSLSKGCELTNLFQATAWQTFLLFALQCINRLPYLCLIWSSHGCCIEETLKFMNFLRAIDLEKAFKHRIYNFESCIISSVYLWTILIILLTISLPICSFVLSLT